MGMSAKLLSPAGQIVEHVAYANLAASSPHSIGAERGSRGGCLAITTDGSVERRDEVGDAGLRVVVEGAVVTTEWGGAEHALDGAEANATEKAWVVGRGEAVGDGGGVQLGLTRSGGVGHEELLQLGAYNEEPEALGLLLCGLLHLDDQREL